MDFASPVYLLSTFFISAFAIELPSKPELLEIFGKVMINSFNIMNNDYQSIGIGLYLAASVFDHSCNPNSVIIFNGKGNYAIPKDFI